MPYAVPMVIRVKPIKIACKDSGTLFRLSMIAETKVVRIAVPAI